MSHPGPRRSASHPTFRTNGVRSPKLGSKQRTYSLAHLTLLDLSPPEFIRVAATAGYDHVSLRIIPLGLPGEPVYDLAHDPVLLRRTRAMLAESGLTVLDIELARIRAESDVSAYRSSLEVAAELGARHVLCSAWCPSEARVHEQFVRLCEIARPLGLAVELEFVTYAACSSLFQAAKLIADAGCDNAGICIDTLHFDRSGHEPNDLDGLPPAWFHMAQICDGPIEWSPATDELKRVAREDRLFIGEGGVDVCGILAHLPIIPCSVELPNARRRMQLGDEAYARRCLERARESLDVATSAPAIVGG